MRLAGIALVAAIPVLVGIYAALLTAKRVAALENAILFVTLLRNDVAYTMTPLPALVCSLASHDKLCRLDFLSECAERCSRGEDFPQAWTQSLSESRELLRQDESERLRRLVLMLIGSDAEGQLRLCDICEKQLTLAHEQALAYKKKYSTLFISLGALACVLVYVLLL